MMQLDHSIPKLVKAAVQSMEPNAFNLALIQSKKWSVAQGDLYNNLFLFRQDADYECFKRFTQAEIEPVNEFISSI